MRCKYHHGKRLTKRGQWVGKGGAVWDCWRWTHVRNEAKRKANGASAIKVMRKLAESRRPSCMMWILAMWRRAPKVRRRRRPEQLCERQATRFVPCPETPIRRGQLIWANVALRCSGNTVSIVVSIVCLDGTYRRTNILDALIAQVSRDYTLRSSQYT